jgi:hypothetical protein
VFIWGVFHRALHASFQPEDKLLDRWLSVVDEQISMMPSLANQKMWAEIEQAIQFGWNVNSVLKVKAVLRPSNLQLNCCFCR